MIVSISTNKIVKLWDMQTGGVIRTSDSDKYGAYSVSISPDGTTIALGTHTGVIRLWDVRTWKYRSIQTWQASTITFVKSSPINPRRFLSSLQDGTVHQWDVDGHQVGASYHKGGGPGGLAYTLDGTRFVSCRGMTATVRDSESRAVVNIFSAPDKSDLSQCCFSLDGRFIACMAGRTIYVWDITISGHPLLGHVEHSNLIALIAFPSSLISGSYNQFVKFWESSNFLAGSITTGHMAAPNGSTTIESVDLFAEDGIIVTSDSFGVVKTWDLTTGGTKSSFSTPAMGRRDTHLAGDTLIIVWTQEGRCHIWDVYKGQLLRRFNSSLSYLRDPKVSGDGSKIFGLAGGHIQAVSMQTGEDVGCVRFQSEEGYNLFVRGSKVGIDNRYDGGWDFGSRAVFSFGEFPDRPRLELVDWPIGPKVDPCWIKDTIAKRQVFRLPERYTKSGTEVPWDGRYLLVLPGPAAEVVVMDFDPVCP